MSDRFPPLRSQASLSARPRDRALPTPAPVDLTLLAALTFLIVLALI